MHVLHVFTSPACRVLQTIGTRYVVINVVCVQAGKKPRATKMHSLQAPPVVVLVCHAFVRDGSTQPDVSVMQFTKEGTSCSSFLSTISPVLCTADGSKLN